MANRTVKEAHTVKGTNPQYLVEKIIRTRIYDAKYWKEECFALSAELIVDKAIELRFVGGVYGGNIKPSPFLCLVLKMLQIQPDKDIVIEFIRQEDFKYVRALGAIYMRLTGTSVDIFKYLEPLYNDYRRLRWMNKMGEFELLHMDEFIDNLLREDTYCSIQLPRLQKREVLEAAAELDPRVSALEEDLENLSSESESEEKEVRAKDHSRATEKRRSKSPTKRRRSRSRDRYDRANRRSRSRERKHQPSSPDRNRRDRDRDRDRGKGDGNREKDRKRNREASYEREIREANELRAKLGLNPLQ